MAESTLRSQAIRSFASARACSSVKIRCQVPFRCQRRKRSYARPHGPYSSGTSRHGVPVRARKRMPSISCLLVHIDGRPDFLPFGNSGSSTAPCSSVRSPRATNRDRLTLKIHFRNTPKEAPRIGAGVLSTRLLSVLDALERGNGSNSTPVCGRAAPLQMTEGPEPVTGAVSCGAAGTSASTSSQRRRRRTRWCLRRRWSRWCRGCLQARGRRTPRRPARYPWRCRVASPC